MATQQIVTYGKGGFDPNKLSNNVVLTETVAIPDEVVNTDTIRSRAKAALAANATLQAAAAPTVGNLGQAQAAVNTIWAAMQVQSKQLTALIYLALGQLDSTSGT